MTRLFAKGSLAAGAITFTSAVPVWAQSPATSDGYPCGPHMMWWGGGGYGMVLGPIVMILALAVVVAVAVLLVRWLGGPWPGSASRHSAPRALDILKERYARGEIDNEEYEARRRVLGE